MTEAWHSAMRMALQYHLHDPNPSIRRMAPANTIECINGVTESRLYNVMTGELKEAA